MDIMYIRCGLQLPRVPSASLMLAVLERCVSLLALKYRRSVCVQFLFNFCSCSAVAAAAMNAGGNALLNTSLVMAAHMVRKSTSPL